MLLNTQGNMRKGIEKEKEREEECDKDEEEPVW
jgi:hypothetical protein